MNEAAGSPTALMRHNVTVHGLPSGVPIVFAHGFGCDQNMWRHVWPAFADAHRIVLFDYLGMGGSLAAAYDPHRHASLDGYARDVLDVLAALELRDVVFVGHSVSASIGVLAAVAAPERFARLVLVAPSPRFLDAPEDGYRGGFTRADIDSLLESLESNYLGWSSAMAPVIMDHPDRPELAQELTNAFCRTDPDIAREFARVTFLADTREVLARVRTPALVLQCARDALAPLEVGRYVDEHLPDSRLVILDTSGHCPNLSAPEQTVAAIREFLAS